MFTPNITLDQINIYRSDVVVLYHTSNFDKITAQEAADHLVFLILNGPITDLHSWLTVFIYGYGVRPPPSYMLYEEWRAEINQILFSTGHYWKVIEIIFSESMGRRTEISLERISALDILGCGLE